MYTLFTEAIRANALKYPEREAITDGINSLLYFELDYLSTLFSMYLKSHNIKKGDRVLLLTDKEPSVMVAILGCLKIGAIYVPLDSLIPETRLKFIIDDLNPSFIVKTQLDEKLETILESFPSINLQELYSKESFLPVLNANESAEFELKGLLNDVAYIIYTSGSTGFPKGVQITNLCLSAFFEAIKEEFPIGNSDKCLNTLPFHFDGSIVDIFYPLFRGAYVYLFKGLPIPLKILTVLEQKEITHFTATAPVLSLFEQSHIAKFKLSLKYIMTGAEACSKDVFNRWLLELPHLCLINGYGPTEATCDALVFKVTQISEDGNYYPIGTPLKNMKAIIRIADSTYLRGAGNGELLISGPQLMLGYWNRDSENKRVLVKIDGDIFYCTGDLCYRDDLGIFHYLGRVDDEVKISGYRIHLNEVRRGVLIQRGIEDCIVGVVNDPRLGKALGAVIVTKSDLTKTFFLDLINNMKEEFPGHMIPQYFLSMDVLPKLPSQKLDKKESLKLLENAVKEVNHSFVSIKNGHLTKII